MQRLAWQTAYLMNATGNFKKNIKPTDLYQSVFDKDEDQEDLSLDKDGAIEQREQLVKELLASFGQTM